MNKLLKLSETHYIIVDDSEIKVGDYYVGWANNYSTEPKQRWVLYNLVSTTNGDTPRKITHSTQPELLGTGWMQSVLPLFLSEVEEAINGYSVEKMALRELESYFGSNLELTKTGKIWVEGYEIGFKAHQELVKDKLFTVEKAIQILEEESFGQGAVSRDEYKARVVSKLQSLLPKTEWEVEFDEQGKIKLI